MLLAIVSRRSPTAVLAAEAVVPRQRAVGLRRETIAGHKPFLFHVVVHVLQVDSKPKFIFPNSFTAMAEITPTSNLVVEIPETSGNPT